MVTSGFVRLLPLSVMEHVASSMYHLQVVKLVVSVVPILVMQMYFHVLSHIETTPSTLSVLALEDLCIFRTSFFLG